MKLDVIGIMSPGDMGHGVGRALRESGWRVLTNLTGRSDRTRGLAESAGLEDAGSLDAIMTEADLVVSIMPPAAAEGFAEEAAQAMATANRRPPFADMNAISPATSTAIGRIINGAGASYIDGGIIGLTPGKAAPPRLYVSGPDAEHLERLTSETMIWRFVGADAGNVPEPDP